MSPPYASTDPLTGLQAARFAVYVHFPYCLSKCPYCDFASTVAKAVPQERYARAVVRELEARATPFAGRQVESVFFGGGTPSLWEPRWVAEVVAAVRAHFALPDDAEVTLEANPGAADSARFEGFRRGGVNRLSLGVQSFQASTLQALGRGHDAQAAREAFLAARRAGFDNVSMDFIYGVHGQTLAQAVDDAQAAVALGSEHLSAYALTLEPDLLAEEVPLAKQLARGEVRLPPDEAVVEMSSAVREVFARAGLERYEISNYARPGFHSRHNAAYWTGGEWLALGVGATGSVAGRRYANLRSAEKYLEAVEAGRLPEASSERLGAQEGFSERVAMGLRLSRGVDLEAACEAYSQEWAPRRTEAQRLVDQGLARWEERRLALTDRGADLHSAISARLM